MPYSEGDHWVIDDRTGRKVLASKTVKEWTGLIVDRNHAIDLQRHPQEIQKIVIEQPVKDARPRPPDVFIGPLEVSTLLAARAGTVFLLVTSITRFRIGDEIGVMLGNLDLWRTTIRQLYSAPLDVAVGAFAELAFSEDADVNATYFYLEVHDPLPWDVDLGALVVDYTQTVASDLAA